jgi:hypothetical protein
MRTWILIAVASVLPGCVHPHPPVAGSSSFQHPPAMSALGQPVSAEVRAQKQECEKLMNALLPFAEQMLSKHRQLHPVGIALTRDGQIIWTTRYDTRSRPFSRNAVAVVEKGLQQGARAGRYEATALVLDVLVVPPGRNAEQHAIAMRLDHRGGYSVVVLYPYEIGEHSLAIGKPFSKWGEQKIFSP